MEALFLCDGGALRRIVPGCPHAPELIPIPRPNLPPGNKLVPFSATQVKAYPSYAPLPKTSVMRGEAIL